MPNEEMPGLGRDIRLACGVLALGVLAYLLYMGAEAPTPYTTRDLVLYGMLASMGLLLIAPGRFLQLVMALKDKIPVIGSKK